jgi:predicted 2-oxoglutarate/Fe(II)-dependent dioxygenase YbiX
MFETSVDDTVAYCDVISATVLATSVTWRSALIASVIWIATEIHDQHQRQQQREFDRGRTAPVRRKAQRPQREPTEI